MNVQDQQQQKQQEPQKKKKEEEKKTESSKISNFKLIDSLNLFFIPVIAKLILEYQEFQGKYEVFWQLPPKILQKLLTQQDNHHVFVKLHQNASHLFLEVEKWNFSVKSRRQFFVISQISKQILSKITKTESWKNLCKIINPISDYHVEPQLKNGEWLTYQSELRNHLHFTSLNFYSFWTNKLLRVIDYPFKIILEDDSITNNFFPIHCRGNFIVWINVIQNKFYITDILSQITKLGGSFENEAPSNFFASKTKCYYVENDISGNRKIIEICLENQQRRCVACFGPFANCYMRSVCNVQAIVWCHSKLFILFDIETTKFHELEELETFFKCRTKEEERIFCSLNIIDDATTTFHFQQEQEEKNKNLDIYKRTTQKDENRIEDISASPDGEILYSVTRKGEIWLWC